ncbi:hypothetical protein BN1708_000516, partial [Verticillium longisporum]
MGDSSSRSGSRTMTQPPSQPTSTTKVETPANDPHSDRSHRPRTSSSASGASTTTTSSHRSAASLAKSALDFSQQAEKLAHHHAADNDNDADVPVEAHFITPHDPVVVTSEGHRIPGVPLEEAHKLNLLREELEDGPHVVQIKQEGEVKDEVGKPTARHSQSTDQIAVAPDQKSHDMQKSQSGSLRRQMPPSHTNPLFPPLPLYGPPSLLRDIQTLIFRFTSFWLSLAFLMVIVLGALFTSIPLVAKQVWYKLTLRNIDETRPFYAEEVKRKKARNDLNEKWKHNNLKKGLGPDKEEVADEYVPTEGGRDPIVCDPGYYARRVGLDIEEFHVQTEDGFIIDLWHVYDPKEYTKLSDEERQARGPHVFTESGKKLKDSTGKPKFPVLLMHGLLQSAGAYCVNDEDSLAFYLCKSGYDVWLGNNRCGFRPKHTILSYSDPRHFCWNIRQMGVFDLPALVSRVLRETGFEKIGLIAHSQGTTQTLVALAKEQRPDLGARLTVFCALAPAAYAGPLIGKAYFKFMRVISPALFRIVFGLGAFIPLMMTMHRLLPPRLYGWLGYKVFSFLFDWSDERWERDLRNRMFQFAPVYVSAESMRWWLGRDCFANHKCILATKEAVQAEEREDHHEGTGPHSLGAGDAGGAKGGAKGGASADAVRAQLDKPRGATAWYDERAPPFALWVAGNDDLVDGRKLLRRFENGREPHVRVVHSKVIPEYEHLDVIWAMDAPQQIFCELREVLWKTCHVRDLCRVPKGCEGVEAWDPRDKPAWPASDELQSSSSEETLSGGREGKGKGKGQ